MHFIICRKHAAFQDIILRGEEDIQKRITTDMNEAKCHFLGVVIIRFFVVYEDPSRKDSEIPIELMLNSKCIIFYGICTEENGRITRRPKYKTVNRYNMCYG